MQIVPQATITSKGTEGHLQRGQVYLEVDDSSFEALKTYFQTRNRILFMRRNAGARRWIFFLFFLLAVLPKHLLTYLLAKKWEHAKSLLAGAWWNLRHSTTSNEIGYLYDKLRFS